MIAVHHIRQCLLNTLDNIFLHLRGVKGENDAISFHLQQRSKERTENSA